jgi:hypothetical protein
MKVKYTTANAHISIAGVIKLALRNDSGGK